MRVTFLDRLACATKEDRCAGCAVENRASKTSSVCACSTVSGNVVASWCGVCLEREGWKKRCAVRMHSQRQDGMHETTWSVLVAVARLIAMELAVACMDNSPQVRDCVMDEIRGWCRGRCLKVRVCWCGS